MYRVFNMGIGMVIIASPRMPIKIKKALPEAKTIGRLQSWTTVQGHLGLNSNA